MSNQLIPEDEFQVEISTIDGIGTVRSLNMNSVSNNDVYQTYDIPDEPVITNSDILQVYLDELLIRFDAAPQYYQKDDYKQLILTIYDTLTYLYINLPISQDLLQGVLNELDNKVDKIIGKGLSTNDLTDLLKSDYDAAYQHSLLKDNPHDVTVQQIGAEVEGAVSGHESTYDHDKFVSDGGFQNTVGELTVDALYLTQNVNESNPKGAGVVGNTGNDDVLWFGNDNYKTRLRGTQVNADGDVYSGGVKLSNVNHNHSLANLTERSYNSLTDLPNLSLLEDIIDVQFWDFDEGGDIPAYAVEGDIFYCLDGILRVLIDEGLQGIDFQWRIYINKDILSDFYGKYYLYNGIELSIIPDGLVLGETASTAFDGERGLAAYNHSISAHAPSDAEKNSIEGIQNNGVELNIVNEKIDINAYSYKNIDDNDYANIISNGISGIYRLGEDLSLPDIYLNDGTWLLEYDANLSKYEIITSTSRYIVSDFAPSFTGGVGQANIISELEVKGHVHSEYVPYTGASQDVDLGNHSISIDSIKIDTVTPLVLSQPGQIGWNSVDGTFDMRLLNNTTLQSGQELHFYGKADGQITNGDVVQFAGVQGDHFLIKVANPIEIDAHPEYLMGIATDNIANNYYGYVTSFGKINGIYTTEWSLEQPILYFDFVNGGMTNVEPQAPTRRIVLASVVKLQTGGAENGVIFVRPTFGCKLTDLDDVNGTPLTVTGQIMVWDNVRGVFDFTDNINNYSLSTHTHNSFGGVTDNTTFEADGTIKFNGAATVWRDIDFPIIIRTTGANIPIMTTFNGNLTMPQWTVNDYNQCESQEFVHEWKEGSTCYFHLHLDTNGLDTTNRYVKFEIEYAYSVNGTWTFPAVVTTSDILIPANTPTKTQIIMSLFNFTPTNTKIGDHCLARLKRVASTGTAPTNNPWIPMLQMHIECDTLGSRDIGTK